MSIIPKNVTVAAAATAYAAGGAGVGFRVEPDPAHLYPLSVFPVTVRTYVDETTYREQLMRDARGRFLAEGFTKLELLGPANTKWIVTVYTTVNDWDEPAMPALDTYANNDAGGGDVLKVLSSMVPTYGEGGASAGGVRHVLSTLASTPRLAESSTGNAAVLKLDAGGRLRTVTEGGGPVLLGSGTLTRATGGTATELLGASVDTSAYRFLCLRVGNVTFIGGTGPTASPGLRSVTPATLGGGADLTLYQYAGGTAAAGAAAEVQVGSGLTNSGAMGSTRCYGARIMQTQALVTFTGAPTGYTVPWELWGEK